MAAEHQCSESELLLEQSTITAKTEGIFYSCVVISASYLNHYSTYMTDSSHVKYIENSWLMICILIVKKY